MNDENWDSGLVDDIDNSFENIDKICKNNPNKAFSDLILTISKINYLTNSVLQSSNTNIIKLNLFWNTLNNKLQSWYSNIMNILNKLAGNIQPKSYTLTIGYPLSISISVTW